MNIFTDRRLNIKHNLNAIIYLSIVQTWLNFNYPALIRGGSILDIGFTSFASIACVFLYLYVFMFPEIYLPLVNLEFLDDFPNPNFVKRLFKLLLFVVSNATYLYLCSINYHGVQNIYYLLWYIHCVATFTLIYRAAIKNKNI